MVTKHDIEQKQLQDQQAQNKLREARSPLEALKKIAGKGFPDLAKKFQQKFKNKMVIDLFKQKLKERILGKLENRMA